MVLFFIQLHRAHIQCLLTNNRNLYLHREQNMNFSAPWTPSWHRSNWANWLFSAKMKFPRKMKLISAPACTNEMNLNNLPTHSIRETPEHQTKKILNACIWPQHAGFKHFFFSTLLSKNNKKRWQFKRMHQLEASVNWRSCWPSVAQ